jgi:hypothetical protein
MHEVVVLAIEQALAANSPANAQSPTMSIANADGAKVFHMELSMYSKRPSVSEILRALRQA